MKSFYCIAIIIILIIFRQEETLKNYFLSDDVIVQDKKRRSHMSTKINLPKTLSILEQSTWKIDLGHEKIKNKNHHSGKKRPVQYTIIFSRLEGTFAWSKRKRRYFYCYEPGHYFVYIYGMYRTAIAKKASVTCLIGSAMLSMHIVLRKSGFIGHINGLFTSRDSDIVLNELIKLF
jgi:hypothetical protein